MFRRSALTIYIAFILIGIAPLSAGGVQESEPVYTGEEGKITVYLSGPAAMLEKLEQTFEEDRGDVLEFVPMGCGPLRQRVWTEWEAGSINADVFWGSDPLIYLKLDEAGALYPYKPADSDMLRDRFQQTGNFTLVNERYGVVIYNKDTVRGAVPTGFNDILSDTYRNAIAHADPAQSSTALALIAGLWELNGEAGAFHRELQRNGLLLTKKNSDVPSKIQEGEFDAGIAPHDAVLRLQKKARKEGYPTPLAICWPTEGAVAIQRPIAISNNAARPETNRRLAEEFVDFMISPKAQTITTLFGFVSVRKDAEKTAGIPGDLSIRFVDWEDLAEKQDSINDSFKKLFN